MKKEDFVSLYRAGMADVHVSPPLKRRTLDVIEGREPVMMKKKVPVVLMIVLAVLLINAGIRHIANNENIPAVFRGTPVLLIYVSLLSLAFSCFTGESLFL